MVSIFTTSPTKCLKVYNNMAASPSGKRVLICKSALPVNKLGENILLNNFIRFNCFSPHVSYSSCVPINASCVIVLIKFGHILLNNSLAVFDLMKIINLWFYYCCYCLLPWWLLWSSGTESYAIMNFHYEKPHPQNV